MKKIETSINITEERKKKLIEASRILNVSVSDILAVLIRKSRIHYKQYNAALWNAVKYQQKCGLNNYLIWHVSLDPVCYEYGVSERLIFKVSVSRIYAVAVDLFLESIIQNGIFSKVHFDDITTNYLHADYDLYFLPSKDKEKWIIKWDKRIKKQE